MENNLFLENKLSESKVIEYQEKSYLTYRKFLAEFSGDLAKDPETAEYPDYYGGSYMNESGYLVIQLTKPLDECGDALQEIAKQDHILFDHVKVSYKELSQTMDELNAYFLDDEQDNKEKDNVVAFGIDEKYNEIFVELEECHFDNIQQFKNTICNLDYLSFKKGDRLELDATARPGVQITRPASNSSIGYRARRGSIQGMVVSGHATMGHLESPMRIGNTNTGDVTHRHVGGSVDAAFVSRGTVALNQTIANTNLVHEAGLRGFPPNGFPISQSGITTGLTHGIIVSSSVTFNPRIDGRTVAFSNLARGNYNANSGDSGGPVFERNGTGNRRFMLGIHVGRASAGPVFCRASNIANALSAHIF